ncbi:MAG: hypothetical protein NDI61_04755 [Bdellovibrionaceae bacterium]|nr:hypothetical protein [Pseudobdellovibrionaceae bacterium]
MVTMSTILPNDVKEDFEIEPECCDFPVEGSREEVEHSARPDVHQTGPDTANATPPPLRTDLPTTPTVESDDRLNHAWRPTEVENHQGRARRSPQDLSQ